MRFCPLVVAAQNMRFRTTTLFVCLTVGSCCMGLLSESLWAFFFATTVLFAILLFADTIWQLNVETTNRAIATLVSTRACFWGCVGLAMSLFVVVFSWEVLAAINSTTRNDDRNHFKLESVEPIGVPGPTKTDWE